MMKEFHLGDVLSVTTGLLVSPSHIEGVYKWLLDQEIAESI